MTRKGTQHTAIRSRGKAARLLGLLSTVAMLALAPVEGTATESKSAWCEDGSYPNLCFAAEHLTDKIYTDMAELEIYLPQEERPEMVEAVADDMVAMFLMIGDEFASDQLRPEVSVLFEIGDVDSLAGPLSVLISQGIDQFGNSLRVDTQLYGLVPDGRVTRVDKMDGFMETLSAQQQIPGLSRTMGRSSIADRVGSVIGSDPALASRFDMNTFSQRGSLISVFPVVVWLGGVLASKTGAFIAGAAVSGGVAVGAGYLGAQWSAEASAEEAARWAAFHAHSDLEKEAAGRENEAREDAEAAEEAAEQAEAEASAAEAAASTLDNEAAQLDNDAEVHDWLAGVARANGDEDEAKEHEAEAAKKRDEAAKKREEEKKKKEEAEKKKKEAEEKRKAEEKAKKTKEDEKKKKEKAKAAAEQYCPDDAGCAAFSPDQLNAYSRLLYGVVLAAATAHEMDCKEEAVDGICLDEDAGSKAFTGNVCGTMNFLVLPAPDEEGRQAWCAFDSFGDARVVSPDDGGFIDPLEEDDTPEGFGGPKGGMPGLVQRESTSG